MFLKSIKIENFQRYEKIFELNELSSGLNIIYGNNEAGKSTLLRALRAILFDRFNGKAGEDYIGYRGGAPEVSIQFEFKGVNYKLEKIFSKRKEGRAVLTDSNGNQWIAAEAEMQLANLLKFDSVDRGLAKQEQQGIYGVLWVSQGQAWEQVRLSENANATHAIQAVLSHEITDMLSRGKGEDLLNTFSTELKQFQTEKTGKPSGEFKSKIESMKDTQEKLDFLKAELANYQEKVDELDDYKKEHYRLTERDAEQENKRKLQKTIDDLQGIEKLFEEYKVYEQNLELLKAKHESAQSKQNDRIKLIESIEKAKYSLDEGKFKNAEVDVDLAQCQSRLLASQVELTEAKKSHDEALSVLDKARSAQELVKLQEHINKTSSQLSQVSKLQDELANLQQKSAQIRIDDFGFNKIKDANKDFETLKIRLDSVATRLRFSIEDADDVLLNNKTLNGSGEELITEAVELKFGANIIAIIPGGDELETLRLNLLRANESMKSLFNKYEVSSIDEADIQVKNKVALSSESKSIKNQINIISPEGADHLKELLAQAKGIEKSLLIKVGQENLCLIEDADALVEKSKNEYEEMQKNERASHDHYTSKKAEAIQIKSQITQMEDAIKALETQLESARKSLSDAQLMGHESELKNNVEDAIEKLSKVKLKLQDVDIEGARLEVDRRRSTLQCFYEKLNKIKQDIHDIELELVAVGHRGLAEEKEQAEHQLVSDSTEIERMSQHIGSLGLLCKILNEEIQKTKELVVKPLSEAMRPYLKILFPDSEPVIDENFNFQNIKRNGILEMFENLSIGTREQLAILIRLAYADLLAESGMLPIVVLDDALVNTDDERREKMKQILFRASQKYQIILLTCHGSAYRDCGGAIHEIN